MDQFVLENPLEARLINNAFRTKVPLIGTLELLPLCNLNCRMCYVRLTPEEMHARGHLLTLDTWIAIARQAKEAGTLFLLLTGGEPLLYPEFRQLYTMLSDMGFILTINTNGTLINKEWAEFFAERPCRRINLTLYGDCRETYRTLCGSADAYDRVMTAAKLLKERNIPFRFNFSVTPYNYDSIPGVYRIARSFDVSVSPCCYMFPPTRNGHMTTNGSRMSPSQMAMARLACFQEEHQEQDITPAVINTLMKVGDQPESESCCGFPCRSGNIGYWVNWMGEMTCCGMMNTQTVNLCNISFSDCWQRIRDAAAKTPRCRKCETCILKKLCNTCIAASLTETGSTTGCPEYLCQATGAFYELLTNYLENKDNHK